jgi:hypothetical protein
VPDFNRQKILSNERRAVSYSDNLITVQDSESIEVATKLIFADGDTTPSVADGFIFQTANTGETIITNFDNPKGDGHKITIYVSDDSTILKHNITRMLMMDGVDLHLYENDIVELLYIADSGLWYQWAGSYT